MREEETDERISEMGLSAVSRGDATIRFDESQCLELAVEATDETSRSYLILCLILYRGFHLIRYVAV